MNILFIVFLFLLKQYYCKEVEEPTGIECSSFTDCDDLICYDGFCRFCNETTQCTERGPVFVCSDDSLCEVKGLFSPFTIREIIATVLVFFGGSIASASGIGGGGIYVPVYILIAGYSSTMAAALSTVTIFGSAISNVCLLLCLRHPHKKKKGYPLIDYNLALLLEPIILCGSTIGVLFNLIFPRWLTLIILFFTLSISSIRTLQKGFKRMFKALFNAEVSIGFRRQKFIFFIPHLKLDFRKKDGRIRFFREFGFEFFSRKTPLNYVEDESDHSFKQQIDDDEEEEDNENKKNDIELKEEGNEKQKEEEKENDNDELEEGGEEIEDHHEGEDRNEEGGEEENEETTSKKLLIQKIRDEDDDPHDDAIDDDDLRGLESINLDISEEEAKKRKKKQKPQTKEEAILSWMVWYEKIRIQPLQVIALLFIWIFLFIVTVLKGSKKTPSMIGVEVCGSTAWIYWFILILSWIVMVGYSFGVGAILFLVHKVKKAIDYVFIQKSSGDQDDETQYNFVNAFLLPLFFLFAGIAAGLLGIGGGMVIGPLFLEMGVIPEVGSATSGMMVLFTSSGTAAQFFMIGELSLSYSLWFGGFGFISSFLGRFAVGIFVNRFKASFAITIAIGFTIGVCTILMATVGVIQIIQSQQAGTMVWGFTSLCG